MKNVKINIEKHSLTIVTPAGLKRDFDFPAVAISIQGKCIKAKTQKGNMQITENGGCKTFYSDGGIDFEITVEPAGSCMIRKKVLISAKKPLPTPDFVIVDYQKQKAPGLLMCGYMTTDGRIVSSTAEEEGAGVTPGCGYPLIGDDLFTGLEHPAAFNRILKQSKNKTEWELRHHPVWNGNRIECIPAVIGIPEDPRKSFMEYLSGIRLPVLKKFFVSFCSFWSDPYLGNYEYKVDKNNYLSLVNAFSAMELNPDVYTLDAGWQDRQSCFKAKKDFGGEKALKNIADEFRKHGADLSLWISHNGPPGMSAEFLKKEGIAIGSGQSSTYSGDDFAVMMDPKLEKMLTTRFCELASDKYGAVHFKMDWENDCATNPDFIEKYPTRDHVREASIDVMSRISAALRKTNPSVLVRNGWWPSPWWLTRSNHTFLSDSGDSEYTCFPSLTQRDAATTHRDTMYYAQQQRDHAAYPLDAYDNHEFAHAPRNPFVESPAVWTNTCLWSFMRGASYLPMTLQPETLEKWQAEILRDVMTFARKNTKKILTGNSRMIGGCPSFGDVYGFIHYSEQNVLLALRNAAPVPQRYTLPDDRPWWIQCYPHYQKFNAGETIWLAPHEVKIFDGLQNDPDLPAEKFMVRKATGKQWSIALPASKCPDVAEIYQIPLLEKKTMQEFKENGSSGLSFGIRSPYKMRDFKLYFKLKGKNAVKIQKIRLACSRYDGFPPFSCWQVPYQEHFFNLPGHGERKNPDLQPEADVRYFSAEIPQGGECFFNLIFEGADFAAKDIELYASGFEAPAEKVIKAEKIRELTVIPQHPDGFPRTIQLL